MVMTSAVYFPAIHPEEALLKRALLTWDEVEVFTGDPAYRCRHLEGEFLEAWELVCRPRIFSNDESTELHRRLTEIAAAGVPDDFRFDYKLDEQARGLFTPRLSSKGVDDSTAELLLELDLAVKDYEGHIRANITTALVVIALQAEIAAGATKQQITDDKGTYSAYCRLIATAGNRDRELPLSGEEELLSVALETVNLQNVTLRQLIDFRKRERNEPEIGAFRRTFSESLENFLLDIPKRRALSESDWKELQGKYRERVKDGIRVLSRQMGCEASAFALSKTILAPILMGVGALSSLLLAHSNPAVAGAVASVTVSDAVISIAEVISEGRKTSNKRAEILEANPLAYIYELAQSV